MSDLDDLEDLALFAAIVENGGVNAASRRLAVPKSRLSRHLASLEARYGVQLVHRSTRRFAVTDLGQSLYERCTALFESTQEARALMKRSQTEPHGLLRVSAPAPLANSWLAPLLPKFLKPYPTLELEIYGSDRDVDLIADRIDVAIRVRPTPLEGSEDLLIRKLGTSHQLLFAAPGFLEKYASPSYPDDLSGMPLIGFTSPQRRTQWQLCNREGHVRVITFTPRLATYELVVLRTAAVEGVGVAMLPAHFCQDEIECGKLQRVLPQWRGPVNTIHAAYLSRRGLSASGRAFLDFLVEELPRAGFGAQPPIDPA